ncbi:MAG: hypothetical protein AB1578_09200 [Thermodesulfobacteriota bacterium]
MFAEDVGLLPGGCFTRLLEEEKDHPDFVPLRTRCVPSTGACARCGCSTRPAAPRTSST